jgi:phosphoglycolate phosphatase-like HAD superfamily hydrolase
MFRIHELRERLARHREAILAEVLEVKDLMRLLMKGRNDRWTAEDLKEIKTHLRHLAEDLPLLAAFLAPGGFLLLPILAEILDRRRDKRRMEIEAKVRAEQRRLASPKAVLFDIDGTLLETGGAGRRAVTRAYADTLGIADGFDDIRMGGKTDRQIVREALRAHGLPETDEQIGRVLNLYLDYLREELLRDASDAKMKPGVRALLETLQKIEGVHLGLLTGNLEEGARLKLAHFGLWEHFPFGAFGSDAEDRNLLVPIALERLRERKGVRLSPPDTLVIGDTPRDVECCRPHGAVAVAVATGSVSLEALREAEPDHLFEDLLDVSKVLEVLFPKNS